MKTLRVIHEQIGVGQSALLQATHPWENGKLGPEMMVTVRTLWRKCAPGDPLDQAVNGQSCVNGFKRQKEMNEAGVFS